MAEKRDAGGRAGRLSSRFLDMFLGFSGWFETAVSVVVMLLILAIVTVAVLRLVTVVYTGLVTGALDPLEFDAFQAAFGAIMTILIALEFKHSIVSGIERRPHVVSVRTVILIALLALSRKFIILDVKMASTTLVAALAVAVVALAASHWLLARSNED